MEQPQTDPPIATRDSAPSDPPPIPEPALPAAAVIVSESKSQRELELEAKLQEANKTLKDRELSLMDLQDKHSQLKQITLPPPKPKKKAERWTLLHDEEED
jgi:hypothetical protein